MIIGMQSQRKKHDEDMIALNKLLKGDYQPVLHFLLLSFLTCSFASPHLVYFPLTYHLTATTDAQSSLKAATEESEQAEATIEALKLQAMKDTDAMTVFRKRVTELETQIKLELMKYQGNTPFLSSKSIHTFI